MPGDLSSKDVARLKALAHDLDVSLQVGKAGVTDAVVTELRDQLRRQDLVKVRLLKSAQEAADRKDLARDLAERAGVVLVEVRGNTAVFHRP